MAPKNYDHSDNSSISLKETFMKHFFYAMDDLRETWKGKPLDKEEFNMDILYLISLIPNDKRQKDVLAKWSKAQDENYQIQENLHLSRGEVVAYSGFAAVTEIVKFLCDSFELATEDIIGPATSDEYMPINPIDLPDMKPRPSDALESSDTPDSSDKLPEFPDIPDE